MNHHHATIRPARRRAAWAFSPLLAVLAGGGCDATGGAPAVSSSTEEATVRGTVTVKGKPSDGGEVQFDPGNSNRRVLPRTAPIEKDGTYMIKTLVGGNRVTVRGPAVDKDLGLAAVVQEVDVASGDSTIAIAVPPAKAP